jgi:hypothetical protein
VFFFSYPTDITFNSFNFGSVGGDKGSFGAAAHVQGIDNPNFPNSNSGWIGDPEGAIQNGVIPEPGTLLLIGTGLIGLAGYGRKKFFKK